MVNGTIVDRLARLREVMQKVGIDYYMIPTADYHGSEYVSEYFMVRQFFSGFTGSNGTLVVWQEGAGLWTDGRYFIQAERELAGTGATLYKSGQEGVPTILEFLKSNMTKGQVLGFDGRVVGASVGLRYERELASLGVLVSYDQDLAEKIWADRPAFPCGKTFAIPAELSGRSVSEKLEDVRAVMKKEETEGFLLTKLDDLMWLFDIRGCDVECNPVALCYGYITAEQTFLFIQPEALNTEVQEHLDAAGVIIRDYKEMAMFLNSEVSQGCRVLVDPEHCNYALYKKVQERTEAVDRKNPTELLKAVKNSVELKNMEKVYLLDSLAVTRFIYWLKKNVGKMEITELTAAEYLDGLRRQIPGFLDLSFPTIAGYRENAAMMHYSATPDSYAALAPEGMLLVDSGGQYMGGTTDVTRTIVLGPVSQEIKKHYTAVASGMLQLAGARWLYGCTGRNLDILARGPLWDLGVDYKCGTGHGIGYILNVHEGPHSIRWKYTEGAGETVLEAGMCVSDEPGVYVEGRYGIRIENILTVKNGEKNQDGQFMYFDVLTYVPIDLEAIDVQYMTESQRRLLNEYHGRVYEKLAPFLQGEELEWLKNVTNPI
ncbi:MAG: aminopeptidase P family protein [Lachnospiraceae bacterium]|nr:aminopeptidase P family protein [Lachnospiraceae bacterium]